MELFGGGSVINGAYPVYFFQFYSDGQVQHLCGGLLGELDSGSAVVGYLFNFPKHFFSFQRQGEEYAKESQLCFRRNIFHNTFLFALATSECITVFTVATVNKVHTVQTHKNI